MPTHVVKKGECLSKIAFAYGLRHWKLIHEHPKNAEFRAARPDPDLIFPGNRIFVPDPSGRFEGAGTEQRHRFRVFSSTLPLKLKVCRPWLMDLGPCSYELRVGDTEHIGRVPPNGVIEHTLPTAVETAELILRPFNDSDQFHWTLKISDLDPLDSTRGIQQRLNNLWFYAGADDGIEGPVTRTGVRCFQRRFGLVIDGIPGRRTQAKLKEVYGC